MSVAGPRVAYVMSRFPKLTETFILNEILAVEREGIRVDVHPLLRERATVLQPGAAELVARARYQPFLSRAILASQLWWLRRRPRAYVGALGALVRDTVGSAGFLGGGLAIFPKVAHAARLMLDDGVEHVHCHFANHPAFAGFVIGRLTGLPWSFTVHGSDLHRDKHMLCRKVAEAAFTVPISEMNRTIIAEHCRRADVARLEVIHCGVDTEVFRPLGSGDPGVASAPGAASVPGTGDPGARAPSGDLRIVAVGTLHEVKGQRHLLDALAGLRAAGVTATLELIGDGPDEVMLRDHARSLGIDPHVTFAGRRTRDEVIERLHRSDVLAAPSVVSSDGRREGIPVVLMEAMACGLPVVASRLSGIPELVRDGVNGLLVEPGDVAGLVAAFRRIAESPALRVTLATAARRTVLEEFDIGLTARRLAERFRASAAARATAAPTAPLEAPV